MKLLCGILTLGGLGWFWLMLLTFGSILGIGATIIWIWMLIEVLTRETNEGNTRLIWTLVIIFTHWLGALIYIFARRQERISKLGR
jgi:hypothetical protein